MKFFQFLFIVFTDHDAAVNINRQINFSTSFTDKLNLRLIKASEYIQRFNLIIKHKSRKHHVVSNALSKLKTDNVNHTISKNGELNALMAFYITSATKISDEFHQQVIHGYITNQI